MWICTKSSGRILLALTVRELSIVHTTLYSAIESSKSYTRQSVDLLRQPIELEMLDILTMVHDMIAECGFAQKAQAVSSCSDSPQVQLQTRVYADTQNAQMETSTTCSYT